MTYSFAQRRVLVTGGAGFIGSHVVHRLIALGAHVTVLDNFSTGTHDNIREHDAVLPVITGDITDRDTCMQAAKNQEIIVHLAAQISVAESLENPVHCFTTNVTGTLNMLEAARHNGVQRFMLASSSAVYGQKNEPCKETDICNPMSPYGYSKFLAEHLVQQYAQLYHLNAFCARFFNVWGPRQNPHGHYAAVVAKFRDLMQKNLPIHIFGNGMQTRDFMHVGDLAHAVLTLMQQPLTRGRVINIASGRSITLLELVEQLKKEFPDYTQETLFNSARPGDIQHSSADCSLYRSLQSI